MLYFGCRYCGSENVQDFGFIRCYNCQRDWPHEVVLVLLPGQIIKRTIINGPGFHYGVYLGYGIVFHSTLDNGAHSTSLREFRQGKDVWACCGPARSEAELRQMWDRARMKQGAQWTAGDNCEDIASYVHGGMATSPTRNLLLLGAGVLLAMQAR
jgi:hypothetical protein